MTAQETYERLREQFGEAVGGASLEAIDPWIEIQAAALPAVCQYLRDEPDLRFDMLHLVSAVDFFTADPKAAAKVDWQPHLQVVYHLSSFTHRHRIVLKVMLPRWKDDVPGQLPEVPTISHLYNTADWHEREVYDLSGVRFTGHPDLRRILCPEDWPGHPLRKDFEMPAEYHGIPTR
ncbi:MAG: NADH-quinone oxidoreductase subunit C [Planctomycetota bacterium]